MHQIVEEIHQANAADTAAIGARILLALPAVPIDGQRVDAWTGALAEAPRTGAATHPRN